MNVNVTQEVASAHRNLEKLCEQFEASVDEFCASPPQIRPHEFYGCECIPIAAACAFAHTEFPNVCSYEVEAYEKEIARSERTLNQQTSELKKNKTQMTTAYEYDVAEAEKAFQQHQLRLEETAGQSIKTVQSKVEELSEVAAKVGVKISGFTDRNPKEFLDNNNVGSDAKISFRKALREAKRQERFSAASHVWIFIIGAIISSLVIKLFHPEASPLFSGIIPPVAVSIISAVIAITFFVLATTGYKKKKARVVMTLKELVPAAEGECVVIQNEMQNEVDKADAVRQQKVKEAGSKRTNYDIQDTEIAAKALAAHEKNVENASSRRDQAIAYIEREYQKFDKRLCQCLDKLQSFVDTWTVKNARVTSILDENWVQKFSENSERIASSCTRVGNLNFWNSIEKNSEVEIEIVHTKTQALSETGAYIRDVLVPVLSKISAKRMDDTQIPVIKPENSGDFDNYLRDIFNDWCAKGDIEFNLLSAFYSILRIAGYEDPKQTIQSWIMSVKELTADALEMPISEFDFLDIDLSIELDQLDVEESFFLFYAYSRNEVDQRKNIKYTAATRLALNALVGEKQQQQMVEVFNKILESE